MALTTLKEILSDTREKKYAVGGFNMNSYEDSEGMVMGAARKHSPIKIGRASCRERVFRAV